MTVGCDIDIRVLKGYGIGYTKPTNKNEKVKRESNIFTNFVHYNLNLPQILRSDINHPAFRYSEYFDSIVCDPPYGHRAFTRKTGMEDDRKLKRERRLRNKYGKLLTDKNEEGSKVDNDQDAHHNVGEDETDINKKEKSELIDKMINLKVTENKNIVYDNKNQVDTHFFAPLKQCSVENIFENLLNLGDLTIKKGGILVCLYPTKVAKGEEE